MTIPSHHRMVIDGEDVEALAGDRFSRTSPAHDTVVTSYPRADADDVDRAARAARRAFDEGPWPKLAAVDRSRVLLRVAALIRRDAAALARLEVLESGKPIDQALGEVATAAELWDYAAALARHAHGDAHNTLGEDVLAMVLREPVGVVAMITPWNFPLLIVSQKLPFALAVGCTAIVKPSELTPGTTVALAGLLREAGLPDGVVNVVTGAGGIGSAMTCHDAVDMVSFTGSTEVGRAVASAAGQRLKKAELELGGKNPQIVCADADLDAALDAVVFGVYFNAGECCNSGSRVLVDRRIAADFQAAVIRRSKEVPVGDPLDPATRIGAITSQEQLDTIERYVAEGTAAGASLALGGSRLPTPTGRFYHPTVFTDVRREMSIAREEIFGPVLSMLTFSSLDEAVSIANDTVYGLSAGIWTSDVNAALTASRTLRAGTIWVNRWMDGYPELPFGGFGASGLGRELGRHAIGEFTETKTVQLQVGPRTTRWLTDPVAG
ncbi:aldehyde dehydrogenase family protein [Amycolatopsis jejuensis]|uniref:aldehyde dehydrogenase family protein n=1 Tax=Amycolatopsis jejuensis TaxID=330084 RepID=UPI0005252A00|nr:aldehyde dehydrogenase family protein [Amycolatopsis jejuensis]